MTIISAELALRRLEAGRPLFPTHQDAMAQLRRLSRRDARSLGKILEQIETFCMFIGYPASGHSLIGSLLDAHAEMAIAHELDALAFIEAEFDFPQIVALLISNAEVFAKVGRRWRDFDYTVPGQWQGRFSRLRVIGDKAGGTTARMLVLNFALLSKIETVVPVRRRFLHVMRNPFDIVSGWVLKQGGAPGSAIPAKPFKTYLKLHAANRRAIAAVGEDAVCNIYHEAMIADPKAELARICRFLGVEAPDDYLAACASIVFPSPRLSRHKLVWDRESIDMVEARLADAPLLAHYRYDA